MPNFTAINIADAQAVPVNHVFTPAGTDAKGVNWFEDTTQASPVGFWRVSTSMKRPVVAFGGAASSDGGRVYRLQFGLQLPVLETVSNSTISGIAPAPTLSHVPRAVVQFIIPERSSLQSRKDLRKMTSLMLSDGSIVTMCEQLQNFY